MVDHVCPFCSYGGEWLAEDDSFAALLDKFPISKGHTLVIPKVHVVDFFVLEPSQLAKLMPFVATVRELLRNEYGIDGYNLGVNGGRVAGQTVDHAHLHLIPRYVGDTDDPRGGIRNIFPDKARYW